MMGDEERVAAIRARCEAATPGPWELDVEYEEDGYYPILIRAAGESILDIDGFYGRGEDCELMAHAREDIPWLLAERDAALARVAKLEALVNAVRAWATNPAAWKSEGQYLAERVRLGDAILDTLEAYDAALVAEGLLGE